MRLFDKIELLYLEIEALEQMIKTRKIRINELNKLARDASVLSQRYYAKGKL